MGLITFDKTQLINLEYSLHKEMVRSNRSGSFSCTTILGCNTRKYHGLLICPQHQLDGQHHVLLSKVDETIIQRDAEFNLGVNKYPGRFHPKGHKYVRDFTAEIIPAVTYRVGGLVMTKETMFVTEKEMVMIRYTLQQAHSPTRIRLNPFLAFRNIHRLSKRNIDLDTKYTSVSNGIRVRMYHGYPFLYLQLSKKNGQYVHAPDWYNDLEYIHEAGRGYEAHEDLYVPGFFEIPIRKGESIILSASTEEVNPLSLTRLFAGEIRKRTPRDSFVNSLRNSAGQFFAIRDQQASITPGFPWMDYSGRYTFISLPGLALAAPKKDICKLVIDRMIARIKGPLFPETIVNQKTVFDAADTSLWFFHAMQHVFADMNKADIWKQYGSVMKQILEGYAQGVPAGISMHENGLIHIDAGSPGLTWMNAISDDRCVTPRYGYVIEINALWYNAIRYAVELAEAAGDNAFAGTWIPVARQIGAVFNEVFWNKKEGFMADFVYDGVQNRQVRPNQLVAAGLKYTPVSTDQMKQVLDTIVQQLLTPRGLRTLSPRDPDYKGRYQGDAYSRDNAYHQGTVWVWPLEFFANAWTKVYGKQGRDYICQLFKGFEDTLTEAGIGTVSEIFEGDPPHRACGAISFAASIGALLQTAKTCKIFDR